MNIVRCSYTKNKKDFVVIFYPSFSEEKYKFQNIPMADAKKIDTANADQTIENMRGVSANAPGSYTQRSQEICLNAVVSAVIVLFRMIYQEMSSKELKSYRRNGMTRNKLFQVFQSHVKHVLLPSDPEDQQAKIRCFTNMMPCADILCRTSLREWAVRWMNCLRNTNPDKCNASIELQVPMYSHCPNDFPNAADFWYRIRTGIVELPVFQLWRLIQFSNLCSNPIMYKEGEKIIVDVANKEIIKIVVEVTGKISADEARKAQSHRTMLNNLGAREEREKTEEPAPSPEINDDYLKVVPAQAKPARFDGSSDSGDVSLAGTESVGAEQQGVPVQDGESSDRVESGENSVNRHRDEDSTHSAGSIYTHDRVDKSLDTDAVDE